MLHILVEKGHVNRRKSGREVIYSPRQSAKLAGLAALKHVLETFFDGALDQALAAHLAKRQKMSSDELARLRALIDAASHDGDAEQTN